VLRQARMERNVRKGLAFAPQLIYKTNDDVLLDHHHLLPGSDGVHVVARSGGALELRGRDGTVHHTLPAPNDAKLQLVRSGLIMISEDDVYMWGYFKSVRSVSFLSLVSCNRNIEATSGNRDVVFWTLGLSDCSNYDQPWS
jgi:hypothetical protein